MEGYNIGSSKIYDNDSKKKKKSQSINGIVLLQGTYIIHEVLQY